MMLHTTVHLATFFLVVLSYLSTSQRQSMLVSVHVKRKPLLQLYIERVAIIAVQLSAAVSVLHEQQDLVNLPASYWYVEENTHLNN
jgi:hypothetical protein